MKTSYFLMFLAIYGFLTGGMMLFNGTNNFFWADTFRFLVGLVAVYFALKTSKK